MAFFCRSILRDRILASLAFWVGVSLCLLLPSPATALFSVGALDTNDLQQPTEDGGARDVEIVGALAYVASGDSGLRIIDVSNPESPVELGAWDTSGEASGIGVVGTLVYVADGAYGLLIIDVSNPSTPVGIGALNTPGSA